MTPLLLLGRPCRPISGRKKFWQQFFNVEEKRERRKKV
jgi:hypothetical protein